jgi:DNA polymerase-3 subunit alpha
VGALRFTGKNKKELLWEANFLQRQGVGVVAPAKPIRSPRPYGFAAGVITNDSGFDVGVEDVVREDTHHGVGVSEAPVRFDTNRNGNPLLFEEEPVTFHLPQLAHHSLDDALDELEILGFSLCNPFDLVDDNPALYMPAARMQEYLGQTIAMLGYLITWKPVHTVKKEMMYFGTYIDTAGDWLDTVHFPDSAKLYPLQGRGFYRMTGTVVEEFGVFNLEVDRMEKIGIKDRAAVKANSLLEKDKSWKQGLIRRE